MAMSLGIYRKLPIDTSTIFLELPIQGHVWVHAGFTTSGSAVFPLTILLRPEIMGGSPKGTSMPKFLVENKFPTSWLALFQALALIVKVSVKIYRELSFWTTTSATSFTARHFSFLYSYQSPSCCTLAQFGLSWHGVMSIIPIDTHVFERKQYHKSI